MQWRVAAWASAVLVLTTACGRKPPGELPAADKLGSMESNLSAIDPSQVKELGSIAPGEQRGADYTSTPLYRSFAFQAAGGAEVTVTAHAEGQDAMVWLTDDAWNVLVDNDDSHGTLDSEATTTLPAGPVRTYHLVFREYQRRDARFTVGLRIGGEPCRGAGCEACTDTLPSYSTLKLPTSSYEVGATALDPCTGVLGFAYVTYASSTTAYLWFQAFDRAGQPVAPAVRVSETVQKARGGPQLRAHRGLFRLAWVVDRQDGRTFDLLYAELTPSGEVQTHELTLASSTSAPWLADLAGDPDSDRVVVSGAVPRNGAWQGALWFVSRHALEHTVYNEPHQPTTNVNPARLAWTRDGLFGVLTEKSWRTSGEPYIPYVRRYRATGELVGDAKVGNSVNQTGITARPGGVTLLLTATVNSQPRKWLQELDAATLSGPIVDLDPNTRFASTYDGSFGFARLDGPYWATAYVYNPSYGLDVVQVSPRGLDSGKREVRRNGSDPYRAHFEVVGGRLMVSWAERRDVRDGGGFLHFVSVVAPP